MALDLLVLAHEGGEDLDEEGVVDLGLEAEVGGIQRLELRQSLQGLLMALFDGLRPVIAQPVVPAVIAHVRGGDGHLFQHVPEPCLSASVEFLFLGHWSSCVVYRVEGQKLKVKSHPSGYGFSLPVLREEARARWPVWPWSLGEFGRG